MSRAVIRAGRGLDHPIDDGLVVASLRVLLDRDDEEIEPTEPGMLDRIDLLPERRLMRPAKQQREADLPARRAVGYLDQLELDRGGVCDSLKVLFRCSANVAATELWI